MALLNYGAFPKIQAYRLVVYPPLMMALCSKRSVQLSLELNGAEFIPHCIVLIEIIVAASSEVRSEEFY